MWSILITGAKSGIGLELVKEWLYHPTHSPNFIIATVRRLSDAQELTTLAANSNGKVHVLELDVTKYNTFNNFANQVSAIVGDQGLNVIHHNAGIIHSEDTLEEATENNLMSHYKVNTVGPILLTKAVLPLLRKAARYNSQRPIGINRGAVIYTSSQLGSITNNTFGKMWGYRDSKCAGNMAMVNIRNELKPDGIGSLMLHPGWVRTKIGGAEATLSPQESASGMIRVIIGLCEHTNGKFIQFDGKELPW